LRKLKGEKKAKKKIFAIFLVTLILASNLGIGIIIRPSMAEGGKESVQNRDSMEKMSEAASQDKTSKQNQVNSSWRDVFERKPEASRDKWNFNDTNAWINFTFADGNRTRLIVGVGGENPADSVELKKMMAKHEARIVNTISIGGRVRAVVVELPLALVSAFVGDVHVMGLASYIEPNMRVQAQFIPNDPYWGLQWGPQKIEADWAWNTTVGDHSVLVAVVDTGIDYSHPDLAANYAPLGYDWANGDADPRDDNGHGTHCAGIIAAVFNNSVGISGVAQVRVMTEKVLDSGGWGYWDWVANGIIHAVDQGANIISMSLGGYGDSELIHEAIKYAYDRGVLLIAAAANDNTNMKSYPAAYDEVVAVAATDQYDSQASFSNWGEWIELAAPGVSIYSTMPTYHVTLNDWGYAMNYDYLSGTSMACPHVSGVAALIWSRFANKTRDWVRLWLRYTADDLGDPGFDEHYGYGRINARKDVEQTPPAHDLIAYEWRTPFYLEPEASGIINATVLNFGESNETGITVQLLANDTIVDSTSIGSIASGNSKTVSLLWNPTVEGLYNVTLYVVPASGEGSLENNVLWKYIYVGVPIKAVVLHSAGNVYGEIISNWQVLSNEWYLFGGTMVYIDYMTLNKDNISYDDINATRADVLIISCASDPYAGWQFTDSEIEAVGQYVHEGHGLIATAGTFYEQVPNNNKLLPLFGLNETTMFTSSGTDLLHLLNTTHPLFKNVPTPLVFPQVGTAIPYDGRWDSNELVGGKYLALGHYQESAIVSYKGLVYISPSLEVIPPYYHHHLQLLYNAMTWSRYQKPEHELIVSLEAPTRLNPRESTQLNATVSNRGRNNETDVKLQLLINGVLADSVTVPELLVDSSYTFSYPWTPAVQGTHNITAYAPPISGEEFTENNMARKMVMVLLIAVRNVLVYTDDPFVPTSSRYVIVALNSLGINYTHYADDPWSFGAALVSQPWDLVIVDHYNYYAVGNYWTELEEYVRDGGRLVLSTFDIDGSNSEPTTLWDTLGVRWVSDMLSSPEPVYRWIPSHPIFTFPNTVGDITSYVSWGPVDYGDHVAATTGTPIAGFTTSPMGDYAAIIVGNMYPTVLFSFTLDDFRYDEDGDGKLDAIELWQNAIVYSARGYEHDLAVTLDAPMLLKTGTSALLNATVQNRGLNDETNVELQLIINGAIVNSASIPELLMEAHCTLGYPWTPTVEGVYNVTAYATPVENETSLKNNMATKLTTVEQPLISPIEGQYANYIIYYTDPYTGMETIGALWNFTYLSYISSYQLNVTISMKDVIDNYTQIGWLVVNVFTRMVEQDSGIYWSGMWFPGWIETNVTIGSTINLLWGNAAIVGNEVMYVGGRPSDCWEIQTETNGYAYSFWYDKASGLWIGMSAKSPYEVANLRLEATNIPLGFAFDHDLALTIHVASMLPLKESTIINATAYNTGLNNETNIALELLINDTVVDQMTIDNLLVAENRTLSYGWVPTRTGAYNVTAYVQPVPGEEYTSNNVATKSASARAVFYSRLYVSQEWIGSGVPMGWHADDSSWQYDLPFDFPFYGTYHRTIYISSNGLITFTGPDSSCGSSIDGLAQKLAIAPAWDDWVTYDPCDIYIWQNSTHVGIRWYVFAYYDRNIFANFEAILRSDGVIQFDYESNNGPVSATVGISNGVDHIIAEDLTNLNHIKTIVFAPLFKAPVASFTYSGAGALMTFDASSSTPGGGYIKSYIWDFGDGNVTTAANPVMTHVYALYGTYNVTLTVQDSEGLADSTWQLVEVQRHDVAVTEVVANRAWVFQGHNAYINVTVKNKGDFPENVTVTLYYNITANKVIDTRNITLLVGQNQTIVFVWNTANAEYCHNYTVTAVATIPEDINPADNTLADGAIKVRILGDANGDGKVDIMDIFLVAKAFGETPDRPRWDPDIDLNEDGKVDIIDIFIVAKNYGKSCSP
jgi:thermitase